MLPKFRARIFRIPIGRINWTTSSFLIGTFVLTLTAVPLYLWYFGLDWFQLVLFAVLLVATGFSITLGYIHLIAVMVSFVLPTWSEAVAVGPDKMADLGSVEARLNEWSALGATGRDLLEASVGSGIYDGATANSSDIIANR